MHFSKSGVLSFSFKSLIYGDGNLFLPLHSQCCESLIHKIRIMAFTNYICELATPISVLFIFVIFLVSSMHTTQQQWKPFSSTTDKSGDRTVPPNIPPPPPSFRGSDKDLFALKSDSSLVIAESSKSNGSVPTIVSSTSQQTPSLLKRQNSYEKSGDSRAANTAEPEPIQGLNYANPYVNNSLQDWTPFEEESDKSIVIPFPVEDEDDTYDDDVLGLLTAENVAEKVADAVPSKVDSASAKSSSSSFSSSDSSDAEEPSVEYRPIDEDNKPSSLTDFAEEGETADDQTAVWKMTTEQWQYYSSIFNRLLSALPQSSLNDDLDCLPLNASVTVQFFKKSQLSENDLQKVWYLSDIDLDGQLTIHEFNIAMHLIVVRKKGFSLPHRLPPSIMKIPNVSNASEDDSTGSNSDEDSSGSLAESHNSNANAYKTLLNTTSDGDESMSSPDVGRARSHTTEANWPKRNATLPSGSVPPLIPPRPNKRPTILGPPLPLILSPPASVRDRSGSSPVRLTIRQSNSEHQVGAKSLLHSSLLSTSEHSSFTDQGNSGADSAKRQELNNERRDLLAQIRALRQRNHVLLRLNNELGHEFHEIQGQSQNLEIRLKHLQSQVKQEI